jgi:hypothetical protein
MILSLRMKEVQIESGPADQAHRSWSRPDRSDGEPQATLETQRLLLSPLASNITITVERLESQDVTGRGELL